MDLFLPLECQRSSLAKLDYEGKRSLCQGEVRIRIQVRSLDANEVRSY